MALASVAARAGVSPGRVQHYYRTRAALVAAAFERGNQANADRIRDRVGASLEDAPPRDVPTAVLAELIPHNRESQAQLRVRQAFNAQALSDDKIADRMLPMYERFHEQLADLLRADRDAGLLPGDLDCAAKAVQLAALAEGLAYYVLIDAYPADAALAQVLASIEAPYEAARSR